MIPFDYITEWRSQAPWTMDAQVEQDLILSRAVVTMFSASAVTHLLAFRGGTALYKLHLRPAARYSEDIDLVQVSPGPIGGVLDVIRQALDPWLGTPRRTTKEGRIVLVYRLSSEGPPPVQMLGTKLRALYQRKKGRDLFDLFIASRRGEVDPRRVVECFLGYLAHEGKRVTRAELEMNPQERLSDETFISDVDPLIAPDTAWNLGEAAGYLYREILPLLPGEPWRGEA